MNQENNIMHMEIKILVSENRKGDLNRFINTCENNGFKVVREGGGNLPNFSGYYATLKGDKWDFADHCSKTLREELEKLRAENERLKKGTGLGVAMVENIALEMQNQKLREVLEYLIENNMCSIKGDEIAKEVLKGLGQ